MKVILFGATGMVGQSALRECLADPEIDEVVAIGRAATGQQHPKLREVVHKDLYDPAPLGAELRADACLFCLGVSSAGMKEADYTRVTYDLTLGVARAMKAENPDVRFAYVSGAGTDGKAMWARVKKRTEDDLLALLPNAVMIRLAIMRPGRGIKSRSKVYRAAYIALWPLFPLVKLFAPSMVITSEQFGRALARVAKGKAPKRVLESRDLVELGKD